VESMATMNRPRQVARSDIGVRIQVTALVQDVRRSDANALSTNRFTLTSRTDGETHVARVLPPVH
jgi:hypothetical protein